MERYRAYIVPRAIVDGQPTNVVLQSNLGVQLCLSLNPHIGVAYLVEGTRISNANWLNRIWGGVSFQSRNEFYDSLRREFKEAAQGQEPSDFERAVEEFANHHRLEATRLAIAKK